jgi:multicomponent Na+:H+ antiporter subunit E
MTLVINILLALVWAVLIGPFSLANLLIGFIVGYAVLYVSTSRQHPSYFRRAWAWAVLIIFTVYELAEANLRVAWYTVSHLGRLRPMVLEVPLVDRLSDLELTMLSMLITLTPGTLTLDIAPDGRSIFVHFIHVDEPQRAIAAVKTGFERRILEATR